MKDKTLNNAAVTVGSLAVGGGTLYNSDRIEKHEHLNVILLIFVSNSLETFTFLQRSQSYLARMYKFLLNDISSGYIIGSQCKRSKNNEGHNFFK